MHIIYLLSLSKAHLINQRPQKGEYRIIDLDLSRYDVLKQRFDDEQNKIGNNLKQIFLLIIKRLISLLRKLN